MTLRFNLSIGQQKDTNRMKEVKRDIARIKTIQRERQLAAEMK
jgi:ribosomal protein L29